MSSYQIIIIKQDHIVRA